MLIIPHLIEITGRRELAAVFAVLTLTASVIGVGMYRTVADIEVDPDWTPRKIYSTKSLEQPAPAPVVKNRYIPKIETNVFYSPLKPGTGWISSRYGMRTLFGKRRMHYGVDIAVPAGSPVFAIKEGIVTRAGRWGTYGIMVEITHDDGLVTRYAHLSRAMCRKGDKVSMGEMVAESGNTGKSTGPHLHFEIRKNGKAVNPTRYVKL